MEARTIADRYGALYITMAMPPWSWSCVRLQCRTCANRGGLATDHAGDRWPEWSRAELIVAGKAREIHTSGGQVMLCVPFEVIDWDEHGGCLLHEVRPIWDGSLIGEPLGVQDMSEFGDHLQVLTSRSHSRPNH